MVQPRRATPPPSWPWIGLAGPGRREEPSVTGVVGGLGEAGFWWLWWPPGRRLLVVSLSAWTLYPLISAQCTQRSPVCPRPVHPRSLCAAPAAICTSQATRGTNFSALILRDHVHSGGLGYARPQIVPAQQSCASRSRGLELSCPGSTLHRRECRASTEQVFGSVGRVWCVEPQTAFHQLLPEARISG